MIRAHEISELCRARILRALGRTQRGQAHSRRLSAQSSSELWRGVFAVTQVEGCLEFICRNGAAALCFPHWGCTVVCSVMPPWRDADILGAQLFTSDALHGSGRATIYVEHAHSDLIVCYNWQCMHSVCPLDRAIFKALCTHCSLHAGHSSDCTGERTCMRLILDFSRSMCA